MDIGDRLVRSFVHSLHEAVRSGTAEQIAAHFTADATVLTGGEALYGRAEILAAANTGLRRWARMKIIRTRPLRKEATAVLVIGAVPFDTAEHNIALMTLTRVDDQLQCATAAITALSPRWRDAFVQKSTPETRKQTTMITENPTLTMIRKFVALGRGELQGRPSTTSGDPDAQHTLTRGMEATGADGEPIAISGALLDLVGPRAPYFDQTVLTALDHGTTQIVNLGVGFEDRSLRFRTHGVTFYDVDLPHVLTERDAQLKAAHTDRAGLTLVAADFTTDNIAELLTAAGHNPSERTLFIAEHLFVFLNPNVISQLLHQIASIAAPGSTVAATIEAHTDGFDSTHVLTTTDEIMFGGTSPLKAIQPRTTWLDSLNDAGWITTNPATISAVDHFAVDIDGRRAHVQTQFITATRDEQR
ncbi:class I SAM-dependent methyltransferase [Curtobacterium sp. VKM Ac-2887]|uniref:class I SAM-dependent methyltransferase n=1 Tax=Curtobacterium sp. VKM Ac-2887 TaxID=2783819 RepID=UPI00188A0AFC|nr:SAM-dependent methyltransferase [Curtobacterium sp. VKM Ac-2887]MBF4588290.1 class I SAM-dependent methyltransferase [Curtobacterium sp. VKM Ac-2887]